MLVSRQTTVAGAILLLALLLLPAPLLPPHRFAEAVQSMLGIGWKAAYLAAALALHAVLYGALGLVAAVALPHASSRGRRLLQLVTAPVALVGIAVLVRSMKLGHVPILANAVVPMTACVLGLLVGLLFRRHGWRVAALGTLALAAGLTWAILPGVSSQLGRATQARLERLVAADLGAATGEDRLGVLLRVAFAPPPSGAEHNPIEHNRAAILALGIAIGHERLARYAGLDREDDLVRAAIPLRQGTTLRGREDWARHYCLSAALVVVENPFMSDAGGIFKEELDALARGSGFSFGDLAADRAGARFASAATDSRSAALAMQARLQGGYSVDDFFPPAADLPENLTVEAFGRDYGGVGDQRYRRMMREIEARLDRCPGLVPR